MSWQQLTALLGALAAVIVAVTGLVKVLRVDRGLKAHIRSHVKRPAAVPPQRPGQ